MSEYIEKKAVTKEIERLLKDENCRLDEPFRPAYHAGIRDVRNFINSLPTQGEVRCKNQSAIRAKFLDQGEGWLYDLIYSFCCGEGVRMAHTKGNLRAFVEHYYPKFKAACIKDLMREADNETLNECIAAVGAADWFSAKDKKRLQDFLRKYRTPSEEIEGISQKVTLIPSNEDADKAAEEACAKCPISGRCFVEDKGRKDACDYLRGVKAGIAYERERKMQRVGEEWGEKVAENSEIIFSADGELTIYSFVGAPRWWATIREAEEALSVFKAGAKYERERMMKGAVEGQVSAIDTARFLDIDQDICDKRLAECKDGDKVKLIILK